MLNLKKNTRAAPGNLPDVVHAITPENMPEDVPEAAPVAGRPRRAHPIRRGVLITVAAFAAYFVVTIAISLAIDPYVGAWNEVVMQLAFRLPLGLVACRLLRKGGTAPAIPVRKLRRGRFLLFVTAFLFLVQVPTQLAFRYAVGTAGSQAAVPFASMEPVADMLNACVLAPIMEEIIFRGMFYALSRRYMGFWPAALTNAVLFASVHSSANMATAALHTPLYCMMYEASGYARYGATLHFAFNALSPIPATLLLQVVPAPLALAMGVAAVAADILLYAKRDRLTAWLAPQD